MSFETIILFLLTEKENWALTLNTYHLNARIKMLNS
jgi:hypothetical protein